MRSFSRYCLLDGVDVDLIVQDPRLVESTLMGYTCFLVEVRGVQVRTALQYCADVRSLYRKRTGRALGDTMADLRDLGRRLTALYPSTPRTRRPFLQQDFAVLWRHLTPGSVAHARLKAMLLLCFQTVSRFSDIVRCDMSDVSRLPSHTVIRIRHHKTKSYTGNRFTEKLLASPADPTAVHATVMSASLALDSYLHLHPPPLHRQDAPLFRSANGSRWSYDDALVSLRRLLLQAGMNPQAYGLHSPRIGGATCALLDADGNELLVRTMGFWLGDSVQRYCRPTAKRILAIQRRMIERTHTAIE